MEIVIELLICFSIPVMYFFIMLTKRGRDIMTKVCFDNNAKGGDYWPYAYVCGYQFFQ